MAAALSLLAACAPPVVTDLDPMEPGAEDVRALNDAILSLHERMQRASARDVEELRDAARPLLSARLAALSALAKDHPREAFSLAFSPALTTSLRRDIGSKDLETRDVWEGELEEIVHDSEDLSVHEVRRTLRVGDHTYALSLEDEAAARGAVRVRGILAGDRIVAESVEEAAPGGVLFANAAATSCTTTGAQSTAVLLLDFPARDVPITASHANDVFFGTNGVSLDRYWRDTSTDAASASGSVFGPFTLDRAYSCDEASALRAAAIAAADASVDFRSYTRLFLVFPKPDGCGWAGLGTLGCTSLSSGDGSFVASTSWMIGDHMMTRDGGVMLAAHEGGHNLGLHHASARDYGSEALGSPTASSTLDEYGDRFSAMGFWNLGYYASPHRVRAGWMSATTVEATGTHTIVPFESTGGGTKAIKIRRGTGSSFLWVEYRRPLGEYDSTLSSQPFGGALVHYDDASTGSRTHLLDFTPGTAEWNDPALLAGQTWDDPYSSLTIRVDSASATELTVTTEFGAMPCVEANPTITIAPPNPSVQAGGTASFTVTVKNEDSSTCSPGSFALSTSMPSGWGSSFSTQSVTLAPGASTTVTMSKTPPAGTPAGTYGVNAVATKGSYSGSDTENVTVVAAPPVLTANVSIPSSSYALGATIPITGGALADGSAAAGAALRFTLVKPNGRIIRRDATAGSGGTSTWSYTPKGSSSRGTWKVTVRATFGTQTVTSPQVTFTVN